ncbi:MAG TPA: hypothetical protein VIX73_03995 [Kofleriaceae bacterium]
MKRLVLVAALLGGACGTTDDRPRTLRYITQTILAPTCAIAQCHSAFKQEVGDEFDTIEAARLSIVANNLVNTDNPTQSELYLSITTGYMSRSDNTVKVRMPFDAPLPDADSQLILEWIQAGAHGAQCVPNAQGLGCAVTFVSRDMPLIYRVVQCPDGDIGADMQVCAGSTVCTVATGTGQCK